MLRNLSRTGYAFLALSQEQGFSLKLFLVRNRVRLLGSQQHTPTLNFGEYPLACTGWNLQRPATGHNIWLQDSKIYTFYWPIIYVPRKYRFYLLVFKLHKIISANYFCKLFLQIISANYFSVLSTEERAVLQKHLRVKL